MKIKNIFSSIVNKKVIVLLLVLISCFTNAQNVGDTFKEDEIKYKITSITPSEVALAKQSSNEIKGEVIIPLTVTNNSIKYRVTTIDRGAFYGCESLTSVTIPRSVKWIGDLAFSGCIRLKAYLVDSKNTIYKSIDGVLFNYKGDTLILYPSGCKQNSYTIPSSVTSIGWEPLGGWTAFDGCTSLAMFSVDPKNTAYKSINGVLFNYKVDELIHYPPSSKQRNYVIPSSVKTIRIKAFKSCDKLESVTIPSSVTSIRWDDYVFEGCTSLTKFSVDSKNTIYKSIDGVLFNYELDKLIKYPTGSKQRNYTIPSSVKSINTNAFKGCDKLESVTIPSSVTSIGYAFTRTRLRSFSVDSESTTYKSINGVLFNYKGDNLIQYPIGSKKINYVIPSLVTSIGIEAFQDCTSLTSITIPSSVSSIGNSAFEKCTSLTSLYSLIQNVKSVKMDSDVFGNIDKTKCILYVPKGKIEDYQKANEWKSFENIKEK